MSRAPGPCLALALATLAAGCAHLEPDRGFAVVEDLLRPRIAHEVRWQQGGDEDAATVAAVEAWLAGPLSVEDAIQVALLNSPRLQATYEALGVSRAELVQAGLLDNPVLVGSSIRPDGSGSRPQLDLAIGHNILSLLMRPARRALAEAQYEQTQLQVGHAVLEVVHDVEKAYYDSVAARQLVQLQRLVTDAALAASEMAARLREAGNLSALAEARERDRFESARVELARGEAHLVDARERLVALLGLWGPRVAIELPQALPEFPSTDVSLEGLEALAVQHRLDLAAAGREVEILAAALGVQRNWRWMAVAEIGIDAERELDGQWLYGPELSLELPIFDHRQAQLARLEAELRRSEQELAALAVEIRSEVRRQRDRLTMLRHLVERYRDVVIPLREQIVALTQEEYNFMLTGVFELLMAKRDEYEAYRDYIEAVRDSWQTLSALQRAVGYSLESAVAPEMPEKPAIPAEPQAPHHHHEEPGS